jgi:peptidyl-prolyl cis-trans isomerase C
MWRCRFTFSFVMVAVLSLAAQTPQPPQNSPGTLQPPVPGVTQAIAATVNGKQIPEKAVTRALSDRTPMPGEKRQEVLNYLIDNVLIDEYLEQMKIEVDPREIDAQFAKVKKEIEATGKEFRSFLDELQISEPELRTQIFSALRWDKFVQQYATDKKVKDFFDGNKSLFDGTSMRARNILISFPAGNAQAAEQARAKVVMLKKQIEDKVTKGLAAAGKLDNLEAEKKRMKLLEDTFAATAALESTCPSKSNGGELGWFPRSGGPVCEAFAKAAFKLKPWEMSDAVQTEYGYHIILCVESKVGAEPRFDDFHEIARDVYADKLREAVVARMRPTAKIAITPPAK